MATLPQPADDRLLRLARHPAAIAAGAGVAAAVLILWQVGDTAIAAGFAAAALVLLGGIVAARRLLPTRIPISAEPDWSVAHAVALASADALAITDRGGRIACANDRYEALFGGFPTPPNIDIGETEAARLGMTGRAAWRDGAARCDLTVRGMAVDASVTRIGDDLLLWRFKAEDTGVATTKVAALVAGAQGDRLGGAGIMTALLTADGRVKAANRVFRARAMGQEDAAIEGRDFARFLITDSAGVVRFEREGLSGNPLRLLQVPFVEEEEAPILVALLDDEPTIAMPAIGSSAASHVRSLVALLPAPLALVDRDGRFVHMNDAFTTAAGVEAGSPPLYPGDLVVREDKGALADAIRRFAGGGGFTTQLTVRFAARAEEPVQIRLTGARGLGDAAVLMSVKDSSEEGKLKRQVAQATKMQAVGQLAGGVAHDFNNILTAIIGHCDLMLMRHTPGDSDYDDIQQIKTNSNRAAGLTRQLLAFSRQQTLRPQVLQLPDVISEVSNLLKRLLGETVSLVVQHGRNLGAVRADPGQLEQVVVNLAVNARDAMLSVNPNGGGTLTIETKAVSAAQVRAMDDDVLPVGDYTALRVSDTGTGIPADVLPKIFEPFFTTKEVGKGTGLGLSTVYGIIKQSGGYIFAENLHGSGAAFTIYLPVHAGGIAPPALAPVRARQGDTWGTGTVLLVEDEDMVRAVAERALSRQGYTVLTAENGEAALELMSGAAAPDLLISDVVMPTMDGPTMVREVRKRFPDLPVLFMSGYAEEQLRRSIDLDNVAFLPKPFSVQQLAEAARDVLGTK
ncbi:two-component system, cell cycle sensor histidine kinase and response regulator CckA [Sphingomonas guangdongensis]|uniref:histidine kinase n=1 Tax=Sphingomonas guangdongensis TaxID=1141890 RepID=A0A285R2D8_9SPHN|nr:response regulator [Sphingomonas guangdongensis]SOB87889.1 two-component system, cell cycle sensor histidine kinase and response regulator CckA [Sphingomonas guangdongensis]